MNRILPVAVLVLSCGSLAVAQSFEPNPALSLDHPAIQYFERPLTDPVARLKRQLESGETKLEFRGPRGYLASVLKQLDVNIDSQLLVFSKTSFQGVLVSPAKPRAVYFNDSVAVGAVQDGDVLELSSLDSTQGVVFYTLDVRQSRHPHFERRDVCLQCHQGISTLGVPGLVTRSVYTSPSGMPAEHAAAVVTDHRTPLADRWGGWYVGGALGGWPHRGNVTVPDRASPEVLARLAPRNTFKIDTSGYLSGTSDIVALMTLEHQTRITNLITRIGWDTRIAIAEGKLDPFQPRLESEIDDMVAYMLFADEAPIHEPIRGISSFTATFSQRGPRDKKGRSLRDFDLHTRLFRYPLSYMIYSEAFERMPDLARQRVYRKLYDVLTGSESGARFTRLSPEDRRNIREILVDTKLNLPAYWR